MTALFRGAEDMHFSPIAVPISDTTVGRFRAGYARCALQSANPVAASRSAPSPNQVLGRGWRIPSSYGIVAGNFWFTARIYNGPSDTVGGSGQFWNALSAGDVCRLQLRRPGNFSFSGTPTFDLIKVDAAGNSTFLATSTGALVTNAVTKIDINLNYSTNGFFRLYADGDLILSYTGDVTTDGVTALTGIDLGSWSTANNGYTDWSEVIWDTTDTRSMGLVTVAPTGAGSLQQWTGTFSDVTQITNNDLSFNSAGSAGLEQLYNNNSLPTGEFSIVDFTSTARAATSGTPAHYDFELVTHAATYDSPNQAPISSLSLQYYFWTTNPNTGLPWTISEINVLQQGMKSVA